MNQSLDEWIQRIILKENLNLTFKVDGNSNVTNTSKGIMALPLGFR